MKSLSFEEYRLEVSKTKEQIKKIFEDIENSGKKSRIIMFSAMGEALAEYGVTFIGSHNTLMMLDELATLVLKAEGLPPNAV